MKNLFYAFAGIIMIMLSCCQLQRKQGDQTQKYRVKLEKFAENKRVDITVDGNLFASYVYSDTLKKPVLFPLIAANGVTVTRGFPLVPAAGESVDHPHHTGFWFNYGNVNGLDFWGNGSWIPDSIKDKYGIVRFKTIDRIGKKAGKGKLSVTHEWVDSRGKILLEETTVFSFAAGPDFRIVDRETRLKALLPEISFADTKEGAFAIRVARFLDFPTASSRVFLDADGKETEVPASMNQGATGNYLSSAGIEGVKVWGTRAKWMKLYGVSGKDTISLVFMDHPSNPNYPTFWHARDYGLFSANPFGVKDFTAGKESLNFRMKMGEYVTFKHRLYIRSGTNFSAADIEKNWKKFSRN